MSKVLSVRVSDQEAAAVDAAAVSRKVSRQVVLAGFVATGLRPQAVRVEALGPDPSPGAVRSAVQAVRPQGPGMRDTVAMARQRRLNEQSQRSRSK